MITVKNEQVFDWMPKNQYVSQKPVLAQYKNGDNEVIILNDGTKMRNKQGKNLFPDHVDLKITNYCDAGCRYCHEMSNRQGKHGDLFLALEMWQDLPAGVEIAIGGGNPLDHPGLIPFLLTCKERGHICNITINQLHLESHADIIKSISYLVHGVGISVRDINTLQSDMILSELNHNCNVVYHLIMGIHTWKDIQHFGESNKLLLLGYKTHGLGQSYKDRTFGAVRGNIEQLQYYLPKLMTREGVISFDNLAIIQLGLRKYFSKKKWDEFYMGDDGEFSMYVDVVKKEYALNSCALDRYPISGNLQESYQELTKNSNVTA